MGKSVWLRLELGVYHSAKVRLARAGAVWPWVLVQLKREGQGGKVPVVNLHPELAAADLHLPVDICDKQIRGLIQHGLLKIRDGMYETPNWDDYQIDQRPTHKRRNKGKSENELETRSPEIPTPTNTSTNTNTDPPSSEVPKLPELVDEPPAREEREEGEELETKVVDGVVHYTVGSVLMLLRDGWPGEDPMAAALARYAADVAKYPKAEIDAILNSKKPDKVWALKVWLERNRRGGRPKPKQPKRATKQQHEEAAAQMKPNDDELLLLADEMYSAGVTPDGPLRAEMVRVLKLHGKEIPEGWS